MKRFTILLAVLLVAASCGTSLTRERMTSVSFADFTAYPDMWISPNDCPQVHQALGQLSVKIVPAIIPRDSRSPRDAVYTNIGSVKQETIGGDELLEIAVAEARKRGANGISNLRVTNLDTHYEITGLLIRIE